MNGRARPADAARLRRRAATRRLAGWLLGAVTGLLICLPPAAGQQQATDAAVKAAYLYNFLPYVEWPAASLPAPDATLVVGVAGAEAVRSELQAIVVGRTVRGHAVTVRAVGDADSLEGLHALFVGRDASLPRLVDRLRGRPVLLVTDVLPGREQAAMLTFVPVQGRIRFEAAPAAAERAGLKLGSRLLAVAERVLTP